MLSQDTNVRCHLIVEEWLVQNIDHLTNTRDRKWCITI